jgi:hypothetical protein
MWRLNRKNEATPGFPCGRPLGPTIVIAVAMALAGCTGLKPSVPVSGTGSKVDATPSKPTEIQTYWDTLDRLAPGDLERQAAELRVTQAAADQNPTASNRLRYAIALGAAGHPASNPVEARRLIAELLAGQHDLRPQEVSLANAYLREFDARVALYADLGRQREEAEKKLQSLDADGDRKYNTLNAETQRLRKALAEAERKLEAVAEMEHALIEDRPASGQ